MPEISSFTASERARRAGESAYLALDDNKREEAYLVGLEEQGPIGVSSAREDEEERGASALLRSSS